MYLRKNVNNWTDEDYMQWVIDSEKILDSMGKLPEREYIYCNSFEEAVSVILSQRH